MNPFQTEWSSDSLRFFVGRAKELRFLKDAFAEDRAIAAIRGLRGVGKTALARAFIEKERSLFPGGTAYLYADALETFQSELKKKIDLPTKAKALLVLDDIETLSSRQAEELKQILDENPKLSLLMIGRMIFSMDLGTVFNLNLGSLSQAEFLAFLKAKFGPKYRTLAQDLYERSEAFYSALSGNPLAAEMAVFSLTSGLVSPEGFYEALKPFDVLGIVGPDGKPYEPLVRPPEKLIVQVTAVNDEVLALLKQDPELLRKVTPRKFEEIVAELLSRQGYEVQLTPASRDGGFDMYAARSDNLGKFLFLVECKRFTPPNKVGIQLVRALHGTVHQTKATAGIIVTTSFFTSDAEEFQREIKYQMSLIDFFEVKEWLGLIGEKP